MKKVDSCQLSVVSTMMAAILATGGLVMAASLEAPAVQTQPLRVLELDQALQIAVDQNRDIQKALQYRKQVEGIYMQERAAALPEFTLHLSGWREGDESQKVFGGGIFPLERDMRIAEVSLSQTLFSWGKVGAAIRAAKVGLATADDQLRIFKQAAIHDVSSAFYDVLLAKELHELAVQDHDQKVRHLDEARRKYTAGVATDYDVLAAEVTVQNARPEVIRTENQIKVARERLRFLLAVDDTEVDCTGTLDSPIADYPTYDVMLPLALERRPDLSDQRHRVGVYHELVKIANADDKPRIDLRGAYGWREMKFGSIHGDGRAWSAGLYLTFPFFDGMRTRGAVTRARADLATAEIDEAKLRDSIALEVRDAVNAVRQAGEIVKALSGTVAQAERLLQMAEKGYEYGAMTRLEVEDAETNVVQAKGNLSIAQRGYLVALAGLGRATGTLGE
ncbi:MAG: TolC family protein [Acidobacteriota bacterium]